MPTVMFEAFMPVETFAPWMFEIPYPSPYKRVAKTFVVVTELETTRFASGCVNEPPDV
jgi:hypothetical protein